mmetsp:Transcript_95563/g.308237  ORF Transcript_95563/g.308237 Transcript_95563/m.308237 type:complete len:322 (+) Transcript_95563:998-1963(+)
MALGGAPRAGIIHSHSSTQAAGPIGVAAATQQQRARRTTRRHRSRARDGEGYVHAGGGHEADGLRVDPPSIDLVEGPTLVAMRPSSITGLPWRVARAACEHRAGRAVGICRRVVRLARTRAEHLADPMFWEGGLLHGAAPNIVTVHTGAIGITAASSGPAGADRHLALDGAVVAWPLPQGLVVPTAHENALEALVARVNDGPSQPLHEVSRGVPKVVVGKRLVPYNDLCQGKVRAVRTLGVDLQGSWVCTASHRHSHGEAVCDRIARRQPGGFATHSQPVVWRPHRLIALPGMGCEPPSVGGFASVALPMSMVPLVVWITM